MIASSSLAHPLALVATGGLLLWIAAELLVRGSSRLAVRFGLSPFLIGATIIAFGTSMPELVVSFIAHVRGDSEVGLGNVLGSNVCNLALVLGLTAVLLPIRVRSRTLRRELPIVLGAEALFAVLAWNASLALGDGVVLLGAFTVIYTWLVHSTTRIAPDPERAGAPPAGPGAAREVLIAVFGMAGLIGGAEVFVSGAVDFSEAAGMSKSTVGATIVAFGTSLPELVTSVVAALRGHIDISVGNLLGSNLFNALLVGGCLATAGTVPVTGADYYHVWWMLAVTVAIFPLATYGRLLERDAKPRVDRLGGLLLTGCYVAYVWGALR